MTTDRLSDGYQPNWDLDLAVGKQGELFVTDICNMLQAGTGQVEIKTDQKIAHTGNVYIEYECRYQGVWKKSGIATTPALIWAFVLPANVLIAAPVESVRAVARRHHKQYFRECPKGDHPTKGVALPVGLFVQELYRYELQVSKEAS